MIKRILVPLDPSEFTETAIRTACAIAKINGSTITGLVILDTEGIHDSIGPLPPGVSFYAKELASSKIEKSKVHIRNLLSKYKKYCVEQGVDFVEAQRQGSPSQRIIETAMFYDVIVTGMRSYFHFETDDHSGESLDHVLDRTVTPVFAVPKSYPTPVVNGKHKVLVCFDGSQSSARAMQRFAQLRAPENIDYTIVMCHKDENYATAMLEEAEQFLISHNAHEVSTRYYNEDILNVVTNKYLEDFDFVVLGSHSKKGIFDFLVGSLAKFMIDDSKTPIFLGQ
jgi:nucleotide-binding universal stress UspA family protein